jgi:hypothetical protein
MTAQGKLAILYLVSVGLGLPFVCLLLALGLAELLLR